MKNKLISLFGILILVSLLLPSHTVQSQVGPPNPEMEWVKNQLPWNRMPECAAIAGVVPLSGPPNLDKPACKVPQKNVISGPSWQPGTLPPAGYEPISKLEPLNPVNTTPNPGATPTVAPSPEITAAQSSSIQNTYYSWATNTINCGTTCNSGAHIVATQWVASTNIPSLTCCYKTWNSYHYANRTHIVSTLTSGACTPGEYGNVGFGLAYGGLNGPQGSSLKIFWEDYAGFNSCLQYWDNSYSFATNTGLAFKIIETVESGQYYWSGYAWIASQWHQFYHIRALAYADALSQGLELNASAGDKSSVLVPLAFVHKAKLTTQGGPYPWDNPTFPTYLQNKSAITADSPWIFMDSSPTNFTSVSAETTYQ